MISGGFTCNSSRLHVDQIDSVLVIRLGCAIDIFSGDSD